MSGLRCRVPCDALEVYLADGRVPLECVVRSKNVRERLAAFVLRRKHPHPLFANVTVESGSGGRGRRILQRVAILDALHDLMRQPALVRLEFQANAGMTALRRMDAGLTPDALDSVVQQSTDLLSLVLRTARA